MLELICKQKSEVLAVNLIVLIPYLYGLYAIILKQFIKRDYTPETDFGKIICIVWFCLVTFCLLFFGFCKLLENSSIILKPIGDFIKYLLC